jgi:hypothetical protein
MRQVFHKITSFVMAFVVFLSTMSFTMVTHFCGDTAVETAIFHKTEGCGMEMDKTSSEGCSFSKNNCCDDVHFVLNGQDELRVDKISFEQQIFVTSFIYSCTNLFEGINKSLVTYRDYQPPLVIRQIYKLDETYLI